MFKAEIMNCDGRTLAITPAMKLVFFLLRFCESYMSSFFFLVEISLIYSMFISGVQQSDSAIYAHIYFFRFFPIIRYYTILNTVPCMIQ